MAVAGALLLIAAARGQTVSFQGHTYAVQVVTLATNVPASATSDLIFVQAGGQKLLALPTDGTARGDFDPANQRFYMLDRTTGQINAFATIDATLIKLDGTFFSTIQQNPPFLSTPLEQISRPLAVPSAQVSTDICIVDQNTIGYRTDGPIITDEFIYNITRQAASTVIGTTLTVLLKNADAANGNLSVFVAYDAANKSFLLSQILLDSSNNTSTVDRITALPADGSNGSEIILENNAALPTYTRGGEVGITVDQTTGTIYLFSSATRQIFVFSIQLPALASIAPSSGTILGGTKTSIKGVSLPADAAVFFGGVAATNVTVSADGTVITAFTPPHAAGAVDVTVTGTGISSSAPLTLTGGFTYVDAPPEAHLSVSPSQGLPPLTVSFSVAGSLDSDGTLVYRTIDFGDGLSFVFPSDLTVVTTTHTYAAAGTYVAKLTVRDDAGLVSSTTVVIVAGEGADLVLRALSFKAGGSKTSKDTMTLRGEIVLPQNINLGGADLVVGFAHPDTGELVDPQTIGGIQNAALDAADPDQAPTGGELSGHLSLHSKVSSKIMHFNIARLRRPGTAPNTYALTFSGVYDLKFKLSPDTLNMSGALGQAVVNLTKHEDGTPVPQSELRMKRVGKVLIIMLFKTKTGDSLQYRKLAVVRILPGKTARISLTRP